MPDEPLPTWWTLSGDRLMDMLRQAATSGDAEGTYMEHYANSEITDVRDDEDTDG